MVKRVSLGQWVDGTYRLRVSAPGYDVDSTALTRRQIIFDSYLGGYGIVLQSGTFYVPVNSSYSGVKIISWPTLDVIPVVYMLVSASWGDRKTFHTMSGFQVWVGAEGIYVNGTATEDLVFYYATVNTGCGA